jgi:streptogramin lyase
MLQGKKGGEMATWTTQISKGVAATFVGVALGLFGSFASEAAPIQSLFVPANDTTTASNGQILEFDSRTGDYVGIAAASQGVSQIQGMTLGPDGSLYGSYFDTNTNTDGRVLRIRPDGGVETFVAPGSGGLYSPLGLTFGPDGHLYVANNLGNVLRFNGTTGAFLDVFASGLSAPQDVVFGPDGHLYVSNGLGDSISRFDGKTGASLGFFVAPDAFGLDAPIGVAFGRTQDLYVASFLGNTIFRFEGISGALISTFDLPYTDGIDTLLDVAFGPDRNLYAAMRPDAGGTRILQLDPDSGAVLGQFASLASPLSFNTGMLFVDQACSSLQSVEGQASGCFAPKPVSEPGTLGLLALGIGGLLIAYRTRRLR